MTHLRSQRNRQRHRRTQALWRFVLIVFIPPLLTGGLFWGMSQVAVETPPETAQKLASAPPAVHATPVPSSQSKATTSIPASRQLSTSGVPASRQSGLTVVDLSTRKQPEPVAHPTAFHSRNSEPSAARDIVSVYESNLPLHAHNSVDDAVFAKLIKLGIKPAKLCSDAVFLRRVYIDVIGTLPRADEAESFLHDTDPRKREKLINVLLERDEYADYWAMKWCDTLRVKAEFPINLWPNAAQAYHHWIRTAIHENMPYDQFVREMLTSSGSNFRTPQVNFYRAMQGKEPETIAKTVALTFMASRAEKWPAERLAGMSQFFTKVGFKPTGEWKEEIVYFDPRRGEDPTAPLRCMAPTGRWIDVPADTDPRSVFTDWLLHQENPWFARAIANRVWHAFFGRGIVDPPDDVRHDNPATNQALLNHLAGELIAAEYDMKQLIRLITRSSAYQISCVDHSGDPHAAPYFAFYSPRRHDAEVLIDAINQITQTTESYMSIIPEPFTFLPDDQRAIAIPDGSITSSFLEIFGRPPRDTGMVSERNNTLSAGQALHLLNSNHIRNKIKKGKGLSEIGKRTVNSTQKAEQLYLTILSRYPDEAEMLIANTWCDDDQGTRELAWALINSDEFIFQH